MRWSDSAGSVAGCGRPPAARFVLCVASRLVTMCKRPTYVTLFACVGEAVFFFACVCLGWFRALVSGQVRLRNHRVSLKRVSLKHSTKRRGSGHLFGPGTQPYTLGKRVAGCGSCRHVQLVAFLCWCRPALGSWRYSPVRVPLMVSCASFCLCLLAYHCVTL